MYLLARLEELVLDPGHAIGWRVWAWAKLLKVAEVVPFPPNWRCGRPALVTTLRRTKTSGPNRRVRELRSLSPSTDLELHRQLRELWKDWLEAQDLGFRGSPYTRLLRAMLEAAGDRQAEEGLPVGILDPLPRSHTSWRSS